MGTLVCQECNSTVDHFEVEKVTILYSKSECCRKKKNSTLEK
ncbi:GapA-binding peptide SR1P [Metabacillus litoralis]|nr:GapA-binding peptide SR1P [Metabacillus litoralis]MCM3652479.1 GapA-binding peptide SR1P [Metabacillus litoralis]